MITNFSLFGIIHIVSILIPCVFFAVVIYVALHIKQEMRIKLRYFLVIAIIAVRSVRYIMDIYYGRFDWFDLFSLQICHIDLILLVVCLIRPNKIIYSFNYFIGIPMGLAVAFMPGRIHPVPGEPRAILFIMSHMMLVGGAVYLTLVENMRPRFNTFIKFAAAGNIGIIFIYIINKLLNTNFLYIMNAPEGSIIKTFDKIFGWPGYVLVMDVIALFLMFFMYILSKVLFRNVNKPI